MAVYTHISEEEMRAHLSRFPLGALESFSGIGEGIDNTNYALKTEKGRFILTLFEGRVREADLPFFLGFMNHLSQKGIPAPAVVADRTGETIVPLKGKASVVTTFLSGAWPRSTTAAHCAAMGGTLARMHLAGRDFGMTRANSTGPAEWRRLLGLCGAKADTVEPSLGAFLGGELSFLEKNTPQGLPRGAVHADVFPDNVFFDGESLSGVIDFYFACTDAFAYDLMLALNAWCFGRDGMPDLEKSAAFLRAYAAIRPLNPEERDSLPLFGRAAALRIVSTRLYDWLHPKDGAIVTPKDPLEHVRILRFHQRAVLKDYGLAA